MTDPLESEFERICNQYAINFTRPERERGGRGPNGSVDFYLPEFGLRVEVKAWSSERLHRQLGNTRSAMVLIGIDGVRAFGKMMERGGFSAALATARS